MGLGGDKKILAKNCPACERPIRDCDHIYDCLIEKDPLDEVLKEICGAFKRDDNGERDEDCFWEVKARLEKTVKDHSGNLYLNT